MLNNHFYHERIRKSVALFGSLFNNIYVLRKDSAGKIINTLKVPLSYAPKRDYLERIRENPDLDNNTKVAIKLPRMSFEIIGYQYDAQKQLAKNNYINKNGIKLYPFVPYLIDMQLNIYAKTQDDALQIVEQIIPFFSPQYTITIKPLVDFSDIKEDIPITLQGVNYSDDYEGDFSRRTIIYTLDFSMPVNFYQDIPSSAPTIKKAIVDFYNDMIDSDGFGVVYTKTSRVTVEPNPLNASPDSDYGFTTTITSVT